MTEHTTTETTTDANATQAAIGELRHLHPNDLDIGENIREYAHLTKAFVASIAEHGVLVPLTAVERADGVVEVRNGQRRAVAARQIGLPTVPVYVLAAHAADTSTEVIERIVHQMVTNDQKEDLSDAQRARGIQQMIDAGLSVTKVAKKLSVSKDTVKAAETAAKSTAALEALEIGQLSLVEAAALTEVDDDADAVSRLVAVAGSAQFDHVLAQIKADRVSAQARADAAAAMVARGYTVLDERRYGWNLDCIPLRYLYLEGHDEDEGAVDPETTGTPSAWAVWLDEYVQYADAKTGEEVPEDAVDWDTEDDPDAEPADGLRHADSVIERPGFEPEWYCLDIEAAGVQVSDMFRRNAEWRTNRDRSPADTASTGTEADAADRAAAQARAEAERAEADKRERRKVVALNKLGAAAIGVRRSFVKTLVSRRTSPNGAALFVAACLARDSFMLTNHHADDIAAELLGVEDHAAVRRLIGGLPDSGDARAQVITLALILAAVEAKTTKEAWRSPAPAVQEQDGDRAPRIYGGVSTGDYLRWLAGNGYTLSRVEQVTTGEISSDVAFDEYVAETGKAKQG